MTTRDFYLKVREMRKLTIKAERALQGKAEWTAKEQEYLRKLVSELDKELEQFTKREIESLPFT